MIMIIIIILNTIHYLLDKVVIYVLCIMEGTKVLLNMLVGKSRHNVRNEVAEH